MNQIKQAIEIVKRFNEIDYYAPEKKEVLIWELRNLGEIVEYVEIDNGRWTNYEGVVSKFVNGEDELYLRLVQEKGKTEVQSDRDYYIAKVIPKEITVTEWNEVAWEHDE